jgi:hypothetical protein
MATMKLLDTTHQYRGYHSDGGLCRIEVYTVAGLPPLVVATELPGNDNTSVTNLAEYLAAEVAERYLTADLTAGHDPPFIWVEHYPRDEVDRRAGLRETRDLVTFSHYRRELVGSGRRWRYRIGGPDWRHLSRQEFEVLLAPYV